MCSNAQFLCSQIFFNYDSPLFGTSKKKCFQAGGGVRRNCNVIGKSGTEGKRSVKLETYFRRKSDFLNRNNLVNLEVNVFYWLCAQCYFHVHWEKLATKNSYLHVCVRFTFAPVGLYPSPSARITSFPGQIYFCTRVWNPSRRRGIQYHWR